MNFDLNYTYTSTYDGAEQDNPNKSSGQTNAQLVRVPRNLLNLNTNFKISGLKNFNFLLSTKWSDVARDYGNGNRTFDDERTDDYFVNDLNVNYKLSENNKLYFNIINLFDEKYETARDYSQLPRTFNFGFKNNANTKITRMSPCRAFLTIVSIRPLRILASSSQAVTFTVFGNSRFLFSTYSLTEADTSRAF